MWNARSNPPTCSRTGEPTGTLLKTASDRRKHARMNCGSATRRTFNCRNLPSSSWLHCLSYPLPAIDLNRRIMRSGTQQKSGVPLASIRPCYVDGDTIFLVHQAVDTHKLGLYTRSGLARQVIGDWEDSGPLEVFTKPTRSRLMNDEQLQNTVCNWTRRINHTLGDHSLRKSLPALDIDNVEYVSH